MDIVGRESERLNRIISDFLNYSREKSYEFSEADVHQLLEETLTLLERHPQFQGKYQIDRALAAPPRSGHPLGVAIPFVATLCCPNRRPYYD